ncbi:MAG: serine hydrolase domain-containing protein [Gemmatimonadales bacterium]
MKTLPLLGLALLVATPARAQDATARLDDLFSWVRPGMPGCAIAVSHRGEVVVNRAYGLANLETAGPIGPRTVFDIGSVQKQFSAAAALLLVEEGRLSLTADIREYLPELPNYGHRITLDHLMTHTSGIRDWVALMNFDETEDARTLIFRQRGLNFAPGEQWMYSNSNFELVKEIVTRVSGMSFAEVARTRLFEPLGMMNTMYATDITTAETGAHAYELEGDHWTPAMMLGNARGGGAILSTVTDLLIWNDALTNGRLGAFVTAKLQEPARLNDGTALEYARGLRVEDTPYGRAVTHGGSARAFKALLVRLPDQALSFAMLCNAGDESERNLEDRRIADLFLPEDLVRQGDSAEAAAQVGQRPAPRARPAETYATSEAELRAFSGRYESEDLGAYFDVRSGDNAVVMQLNGAQTLTLPSVERDLFQRGPLTVRFVRDAAGQVTALDFSTPALRNVRFARAQGNH